VAGNRLDAEVRLDASVGVVPEAHPAASADVVPQVPPGALEDAVPQGQADVNQVPPAASEVEELPEQPVGLPQGQQDAWPTELRVGPERLAQRPQGLALQVPAPGS
jgi:hypothetical protein